MLPEALPHEPLEDRDIPLGVQPPAVDDADAAMAVATIVDEPLQARDGFRGGLAMQVEPAARCRMLPILESQIGNVGSDDAGGKVTHYFKRRRS
jgi:hypothetical protein